MTGATLNRVSLVTEVDSPVRPPERKYFIDPAWLDPPFSRVIFHEATHYWQQLSQTFLLMVALEDWGRIQKFRRRGRADGPGPLNTLLRTRDPALGYSANDIAEGFSRYWDVLNIGPHNLVESELAGGATMDDETRDLYDRARAQGMFRSPDDGFTQFTVELAMRVGGGSYARPYLDLVTRLGGPDSPHAMTLFPLVAHWALQSPKRDRQLAHLRRRVVGRVAQR